MLFKAKTNISCLLSRINLFIGIIILFSACFVLLSPSDSEARRPSGRTHFDFSVLSVNFDYGLKSGDFTEGSTFRQRYRFVYNGHVLDHRLVTYRVNLDYMQDTSDGFYGKNDWQSGIGFTLKLFEGIDREKGIELWKYVPSPLTIFYNYMPSTHYNAKQYGINLYYHRKGYLRLFGRGRLIFFDDGRKKAGRANQANRYRLKYNDNSFNYNRNGNGNWNRNGNGNWNRNGNGNWNANANANGNANSNWGGNANGNANGNGNWNGNGNGNWNGTGNGNANSNGNGNWGANRFNQNTRSSVSRFGFVFPAMSFDMFKTDIKGTGTNQVDSFVSSRNFRAGTESIPNRNADYSARYTIWDRSSKSSYSDESSRGFRAKNDWKHIVMRNDLYEDIRDGNKTLNYILDVEKDGKLGNWDYRVGLDGRYIETALLTTELLGVDLGISSSKLQNYRISPKIYSYTDVDISFARQETASSTGQIVQGDDLYSLIVMERLKFYHFEKVVPEVKVRTGVTESGSPLELMLAVSSAQSRRYRYRVHYIHNTFFSKIDANKTVTQAIGGTLNFNPTYNLSIGQSLRMIQYLQSPSTTLSDITEYDMDIGWKIRTYAYMTMTFNTVMTDSVDTSIFSARLNTKTGLRSTLSVAYRSNWDNLTDGSDDRISARMLWRYRAVNASVEFETYKSRADIIENTLWVKLSRNFFWR